MLSRHSNSELARAPHRSRARWLALGLGLALWGAAPEASAAEPGQDTGEGYVFDAGKTRFGTARMSWNFAPTLHLQPERARVTLQLPPEWMPAPTVNIRGLYLPTTKNFDFRGSFHTRATIGSRIALHISAPQQAVDFGLSFSGRSAVAILRFDPISWAE